MVPVMELTSSWSNSALVGVTGMREQVAMHCSGVTTGPEVHRCLGAVGRLQYDKEVLFDLETLYPLGTSPRFVVGGPSE